MRSVALGLIGVVLICSLTAYNDFVVANTYLVGSALPLGLLLYFLIVVLFVNAPLHRWWPRRAFSSGELAVALVMVLVGCGLPSTGLMRYLPAQLIAPWQHATTNSNYRAMLDDLNLASWVFPTFPSETISARDRAADPVVANFWNRDPRPRNSWLDNWRAVPWRAWARPAIAWGILGVCVYGMVFCGAVIVRKQWTQNERLPFPLATIYSSLIEPPPRGRALNALFGSRGFWLAAGGVFLLDSINALHEYLPQRVPHIPLGYDLSTLMSSPPWSYADWALPTSTLYFSIVGLVFFVQSRIAFSLWFFYAIFFQVERMTFSSFGVFHEGMKTDQLFGGLLAFTVSILWVGRHHWIRVVREMTAKPQAEDSTDERYLSYRAAGWGFVAFTLAIAAWLIAAGASVAGAVVAVAMMLMIFLVTARAVAETGLIFVQFNVPLYQPWVYALNDVPAALATRTKLESYFLGALVGTVFARDVRESMPIYATHALKVADDNVPDRRSGFSILMAMAAAIVVAYVVSGASILYVEYNHAATLDVIPQIPNEWAMVRGAKEWTINPPSEYRPPGSGPREGQNRVANFTFGAALTALLSALRLRFVNWPLHPLGFLLAYSYPISVLWFSIFVGWLTKVLLTRFGGAELLRAARPIFIGLIIGEAGTAAFWLVVNLILASSGLAYHRISLFPV
jgi:hypothetical protein